ncbi:hypothetical protein DFQ27_006832 [Actinomortierella ambigua]|uniref:Uncharacterized protein n=1 Tax=Actinomortierella ambigua TaxID=1343610 RepID=A0A9P6PWY8_9FUNG|nr:hypothetical protein DFQ27_006832 [Actinomortierella ambigua]
MVQVHTYADGKLVPYETIRQWEAKRLAHVTSFVYRLLGKKQPPPSSTQTMDEQRSNLAELKVEMGEDKMRKLLSPYLGLSRLATKAISFLSFGRRSYSIVEIAIVSGSTDDLGPSEFLDKLNRVLQSEDEASSKKMRLMACPDHYLLANTGGGTNAATMEVIETTGGSPFPTQFFIRFGDETGMRSQRDPAYEVQMVGAARTKCGMVIGAVRHQIRREPGGLRMKLLIEFPLLTPNWMLRQHQAHLMCEFNNWVRDALAIAPHP